MYLFDLRLSGQSEYAGGQNKKQSKTRCIPQHQYEQQQQRTDAAACISIRDSRHRASLAQAGVTCRRAGLTRLGRLSPALAWIGGVANQIAVGAGGCRGFGPPRPYGWQGGELGEAFREREERRGWLTSCHEQSTYQQHQ